MEPNRRTCVDCHNNCVAPAPYNTNGPFYSPQYQQPGRFYLQSPYQQPGPYHLPSPIYHPPGSFYLQSFMYHPPGPCDSYPYERDNHNRRDRNQPAELSLERSARARPGPYERDYHNRRDGNNPAELS